MLRTMHDAACNSGTAENGGQYRSKEVAVPQTVHCRQLGYEQLCGAKDRYPYEDGYVWAGRMVCHIHVL